MKSLQVTPIQTEIYTGNEALADFITRHLKTLPEGSILAVTSKIISLAEGRTVSRSSIDKTDLILREADRDLGEGGFGCRLTLKEGLLIPSAGIDESNSPNGDYILYPQCPFESAQRLHRELLARFGLHELGVLITDSRTFPLRRGVTGVGLSYWGFRGVRNLIGQSDLFGRPLQMTQMNLVDGLAASAVLMMGEGNESSPLALITGGSVEFVAEIDPTEMRIAPELDLYSSLLLRND